MSWFLSISSLKKGNSYLILSGGIGEGGGPFLGLLLVACLDIIILTIFTVTHVRLMSTV